MPVSASTREYKPMDPTALTPNLIIHDPLTAYWFAQVTLRLRCEVAWCWYQRTATLQPDAGILPPLADSAAENLDLVRFEQDRQLFMQTDPAARYLSEHLQSLAKPRDGNGYWHELTERLQLTEAAQFVIALALAARIDAGLAPVFACCMNDLSRPFATLALAQRLWSKPAAIIECADPNHAVHRFGLLQDIFDGQGPVWQRALDMPAALAHMLVDADAPLPQSLQNMPLVHNARCDAGLAGELLVARIRSGQDRMQIVPLLGPKDAAFDDWALALAYKLQRPLLRVGERRLPPPSQLRTLALISWLRDADLVLPEQWLPDHDHRDHFDTLRVLGTVPITWYAPVQESRQLQSLPGGLVLPPLHIESLGFEQRVDEFTARLGGAGQSMRDAIEECARRFRFQPQKIARVARAFADGRVALTSDNLLAACAAEASIEVDNLAQPVRPRFEAGDLVLPPLQMQQFDGILHAMQSLTVVHYHWGTARVWNEGGLAVLFCGSPGTGKTMAAEALAAALALPMYRIDLSQVVNKYIGETEKNLKRIFDAAELADCILFFDEADALFGKRTDVKDAHDRFANIEISYLLERMERFKGLAILATNRRRDLDEAFMRRLRYVIEFPVPAYDERRRIWQQVFPAQVDISELDLHYLAKQFSLAGGHIRSIALNACLHAADANQPQAKAKVAMRNVVIAIRRELEKMDRSSSVEVFGSYGHLLADCA